MEVKAKKLVLKSGTGDVVRVVNWPETTRQAYVIRRLDTGRMEIKADLSQLEADDVPFEKLHQISVDDLKKDGMAVSAELRLVAVDSIIKTDLNIVVPKDKDEESFKKILTYTGGGHIAVILLIFLMGFVIEPLFKPEEVVVKVVQQKDLVRPQFDRKTVQMSETKIDRTKPVTKKVVTRPVDNNRKTSLRPKTPTRNKSGQSRTKVNVANTGALGVLGGMANGSKNSAGFNLNSMVNSRGSSVSAEGAGGAGGNSRALPGKGLVASGVGSGGAAKGSGGYGTRGSGGGRPGYGKMNMGGSSGAYFQPLEEEAVVQGGLDRDQIHAVIQKHMGQIVYCYEKGLQVDPNAGGRVDVRFIIGGSGRVSTAKVASSSVGSSIVDSCIINKLSGWKFPKPHGNVNVQVSYPFQLRRVGQG